MNRKYAKLKEKSKEIIKVEFIDFLDRVEMEIIRIVERVGYSLEENTTLCLSSKKYVGFLKKSEKKIIICTDNAKNKEFYTLIRRRNNEIIERISIHIKKALRHEAVHLAQECNNGNLINMNQNLSINPSKYEALKRSTIISGDKRKEMQAYILEDKPKLVKEALEKYCL